MVKIDLDAGFMKLWACVHWTWLHSWIAWFCYVTRVGCWIGYVKKRNLCYGNASGL